MYVINNTSCRQVLFLVAFVLTDVSLNSDWSTGQETKQTERTDADHWVGSLAEVGRSSREV